MNKKHRRKFKLKVSEYIIKPEDREAIIMKHKHIADLRLKSKSVSKDQKDIINLFQKEIANVREDLVNNYAHKFYLTTVLLGPHKEEQYLPYYPASEDVLSIRDKLLAKIAKKRIGNKTMKIHYKQFNGIEYEMVGNNNGNDKDRSWDAVPTAVTWGTTDRVGINYPPPITNKPPKVKTETKVLMPELKGNGNVFMEPGSMLRLLEGPGYAKRIRRAKKPYDKSNYVGIEIELVCKVSREVLEEMFINARLAGNVYLKDDTSIRKESGDEWTHEITMIGKQEYINGIVERVCAVLNTSEVGSYVNDSCGIHVHVDMRNRVYENCFKNFVNSLPVLVAMVPASRTLSQYCKPNISNDSNFSSGDHIQDRRQAINPRSYSTHGTVEIRLHSGSTNATKINNWVNILTAIADKKDAIDFKIASPEDMQHMFGIDSKLVEYIMRRINKFKNDKTITTKDDHLDQSA